MSRFVIARLAQQAVAIQIQNPFAQRTPYLFPIPYSLFSIHYMKNVSECTQSAGGPFGSPALCVQALPFFM